MDIDKELREIEAIHGAYNDLVAHGTPSGNRITVSIADLVKLQKRLDQLREDLREAANLAHSTHQ
jgi:hypothetical protein